MYHIKRYETYDLRSIEEISPINRISPVSPWKKVNQGPPGKDNFQKQYLAYRGVVPQIFPQNSKKAWPKTQIKHLHYIRISYIISLEHIRGGDLYGKR